MIYTDYFYTLAGLYKMYASGQIKDPRLERGLNFLGNFLVPNETHIIRVSETDAQKYPTMAPRLISNPEIYGTEFRLPYPGVVVEDSISAIGIVDIKKPAVGLKSHRMYFLIENQDTSTEDQTVSEFLRSIDNKVNFPNGFFVVNWGMIVEVQNLNFNGDIAKIALSPFGMSLFDMNQVHTFETSLFFDTHLRLPPKADYSEFDAIIAKWGEPLVQTLSEAFLQIAFHNALSIK